MNKNSEMCRDSQSVILIRKGNFYTPMYLWSTCKKHLTCLFPEQAANR